MRLFIRLFAALTVAMLLSTVFVERTGPPDPDLYEGPNPDPSRYSDIPTVEIDPAKVPAEFRNLISLAKEWSIGDDVQLENYIRSVPDQRKRELVEAFAPHMTALWRWHTECENMIPQPDELVVFDAAVNAVETVKYELQQRGN